MWGLGRVHTMAARISGALMAEKRARYTCWPGTLTIHFSVFSITCSPCPEFSLLADLAPPPQACTGVLFENRILGMFWTSSSGSRGC